MDYSGSQMSALVFTVLSTDRPGLVEKVSGTVTGHGGNWLGSYLSSLGGCFGGMVHVEVPEERKPELSAALHALESEGIQVTVQTTDSVAAPPVPSAVAIEVVGNDQPGIVARISRVIAARGINLTELETDWNSAPMAGHAIFRARAVLLVPPDASLAELKRDLERIASDLMVDLKID